MSRENVSPGSRAPLLGSPLIVAVLTGAVYAGLSHAGLSHAVTVVTAFGGSSGTTFWPAAGVTVAVLLLTERRTWALTLAAVWIAEFILNFFVHDVPLRVSIGWAFANIVEPLLAAMLLRRRGAGSPDPTSRADVLPFVALAVFVGPALGALVGVGSATMLGFYDLWPALPRWFVGDAVGALVVAPMVLALLRPPTRLRVTASEAGAIAGLLVVALLATAPWHVPWDQALPFAVLPFLVLAVLQAGSRAGVVGVGVVAVAVNGMTAAGYGPFATTDQIVGLVEAQAFLAAAAFTVLTVAALTRDLVSRTEMDEAKNAYVEAVAHDLRGPLATIAGMAELLSGEGSGTLTPDRQQDMLRRIVRQTERLSTLVTDVLDLQRLTQSGMPLDRRPTDLAAVMASAVDGIHLGEHPLETAPCDIVCNVDPVQVERIVTNLVANAVRHTPDGTPVWLSAERSDGGVTITVEDAGPGVDDAMKERIFQPFLRGANKMGSGIGLTLVARFAAHHGGRAWVEDRPAGGAVFKVSLPDDGGGPA